MEKGVVRIKEVFGVSQFVQFCKVSPSVTLFGVSQIVQFCKVSQSAQ